MHNPETHHEEHMPKVDAEGREVVRVVADNDAGWRYAYADSLENEKLYTGKIKDKEATSGPIKHKANHSNVAPNGSNVANPEAASQTDLNIENNPNPWGNPT